MEWFSLFHTEVNLSSLGFSHFTWVFLRFNIYYWISSSRTYIFSGRISLFKGKMYLIMLSVMYGGMFRYNSFIIICIQI